MMLDDDGLPLDDVGPWAKEKHERLRKYIDISRATRRKYVDDKGDGAYKGGATYIDLFCGSGRAIIRDTDERIDGSPLVAFKSARDGGAPFSEIYLADISEENCRVAEKRLVNAGGSARIDVGEAQDTAARIVAKLNPYGLHFAFLDPYNLQDLAFSAIEAFAKLRRIDMLIHVSAQDLQRNLAIYIAPDDERLESFAPGWRKAVDVRQTQPAIRAAILEYWGEKIESLGLSFAKHAALISGAERNQRLYWLVFASRSDFAVGLWDKIRNISGQADLGL